MTFYVMQRKKSVQPRNELHTFFNAQNAAAQGGDVQPGSHLFSDGSAAAAKFTADGKYAG